MVYLIADPYTQPTTSMATATETPAVNKTHRIIVLDVLAEEGLAKLDAAPNVEYDVRLKLAGDELREALNEYDGAVLRSGDERALGEHLRSIWNHRRDRYSETRTQVSVLRPKVEMSFIGG